MRDPMDPRGAIPLVLKDPQTVRYLGARVTERQLEQIQEVALGEILGKMKLETQLGHQNMMVDRGAHRTGHAASFSSPAAQIYRSCENADHYSQLAHNPHPRGPSDAIAAVREPANRTRIRNGRGRAVIGGALQR